MNISQEHRDRRVVEAICEDVEKLRDHNGEWAEAYADAARFIDGVYDEYIPELPQAAREFGRLIGATALATHTVYYGASADAPRLYSGTTEKRVPATYHHAGHPMMFIKDGVQYMADINDSHPDTYLDDDFAKMAGIGATHDLIMGNDRIIDERQSALAADALERQLGLVVVKDVATITAIETTTWVAGSQNVDPTKGHVPLQRAAGVADLRPMFDRRGFEISMTLGPEDLAKHAFGQILTHVADEVGFDTEGRSVDELMEFIAAHEILAMAFGRFLDGTLDFYRTFAPADPNLDQMYSGRQGNIEQIALAAILYKEKQLDAPGVLDMARQYAR